MRTVNFTKTAFNEYNSWRSENRKIQDRIADLIEDILRHPFEGIGKPEPLRHHLKGFWSRRINEEHRLVYEVTENAIKIISCKDHIPSFDQVSCCKRNQTVQECDATMMLW